MLDQLYFGIMACKFHEIYFFWIIQMFKNQLSKVKKNTFNANDIIKKKSLFSYLF